jgi:hypothetical protein
MAREVALSVLAALLLLALVQQRERPAVQRWRTTRERPQDPPDEDGGTKAGTGLAERTALAGMAAATVGCFGELVAPLLEPLWFTLLGLGFASLPAALAAPAVERRLQSRARRRPTTDE